MGHRWIQGGLSGTLHTISGLHIGGNSENTGGAVITTFVRDESGRPFVPGSTLKGALRTQAQMGIRTLTNEADGVIRACDFPESLDHESLWFCVRAGDMSDLCAVCGLFGSTVSPSRVFFRNLSLCGKWSESLMQRRTTLGISRGFGRGIRGSERMIEMIPPGLDFEFEILVSEPLDWELGLLFWAIDRLGDALGLLGGGRRLGLGRVSLQVNQVVMRSMGDGLSIASETYLPAPEMQSPDEGKRPDPEKPIGVPKPSTDNMGAVLCYCLELMKIKNVHADAGEIGKLLSSEFGLSKRRRKELGLPEKVSELLDRMVLDSKLEKSYLGYYSISPNYVQEKPSQKAKRAEHAISERRDLDEFKAQCQEALRRKLFRDTEAQ